MPDEHDSRFPSLPSDPTLPQFCILSRGFRPASDHSFPAWPLSPPYSVSSEGYMKRQRTSASPSPSRPLKKGKETENVETMASRSPSPPGPRHTPNPMAPVPSSRPSRPDRRMSINMILSSDPTPRPLSVETPLAFLSQDDLCVRQPFKLYLTYASALSWRREELHEVEKTLAEADSLIHDLATELERAENAKPRRARIIGPIRTRLQSAETQKDNASAKVEAAKTRVAFSENTMRAMQAVLSNFGWRIDTNGEAKLRPHPDHPAARS